MNTRPGDLAKWRRSSNSVAVRSIARCASETDLLPVSISRSPTLISAGASTVASTRRSTARTLATSSLGLNGLTR